VKLSAVVYDMIILDYQERLKAIRNGREEYTELYTRFLEDIVIFCKNNDLNVNDVMVDIELK
jgi:hypothetical protein